ncbi:helix-turn-helix domain-containing protein [Haliea atlantica]
MFLYITNTYYLFIHIMSYSTEHIARSLKQARIDKKLSQRSLAAKAGVPQSHLSKIENGAVDLRLSSLIELARVLDLELLLVPRKTASAVNAVIGSLSREGQKSKPAYSLDEEDSNV